MAVAFAVYALAAAVFLPVTDQEAHRVWAEWALFGYLTSLVLAFTRWRLASPSVAFALAVLAPLLYEAASGIAQPEVGVVVDGAEAWLASGTPYAVHASSLDEFRPYLPTLFVFGLPASVTVLNVATDPRLSALIILLLAIRLVDRAELSASQGTLHASRPYLLLIVSPPVALALATSFIDIPLAAATLFALTALSRKQHLLAGVVIGLALAMKPTALVLAFLALIFVASSGSKRDLARTGVGLSAAASLAVLPVLMVDPDGLLRNAVMFPLGKTDVESPAQSPFPGVLIASWAPNGTYFSLAILCCVALGYAFWCVWRPPADIYAVAGRIATGLVLATLLAPASRAGYLVYPALVYFTFRFARRDRAPVESNVG